jgi:hypothetical protein
MPDFAVTQIAWTAYAHDASGGTLPRSETVTDAGGVPQEAIVAALKAEYGYAPVSFAFKHITDFDAYWKGRLAKISAHDPEVWERGFVAKRVRE